MVVKIRGTVSRLCASTSGRAPKTPASSSGTALKSGISSSTPVPGPPPEPWHRPRAADPGLQRRPGAARGGLRGASRGAGAHLETVPRIFTTIRPGFRYDRSLSVLTAARDDGLVTKSNLILGMGETYHEVVSALGDLRDAGCDLVTITQYLRPSVRHHPVDRWVRPEEFVALADEAERMGFLGVM